MFIVGLDIGYSNLKLVSGELGEWPAKALRPVGAAPLDRLPERINGSQDSVLQVVVNGEIYATGVSPHRLQGWRRVLHEDYPFTTVYQALFYGALLLAGQTQVDYLITGLPVDQYQDAERRRTLRQRLTGDHQVTAARRVRVSEVIIVPQPIGSYLDLLDHYGDASDLQDTQVLVIDPGFYSTDWAFVVEGELRSWASGTSHLATSVVLDEVCRGLAGQWGRVNRERVEQALQQGRETLTLGGEPVPLGPLLEQAAQRVVPHVLDAVQETLRQERGEVDLIVLTGGGASLHEEATRDRFRRSQVLVAEDPVFANARGFWLCGCEAARN